MHRIILITILLSCAGITNIGICAETINVAPKFNPYMPGELNEYALYVLQTGDADTARILLERAYRLNPLSPDIKDNLELVRSLYESQETYNIEGAVQSFDMIPISNISVEIIPEELIDPWVKQ